MELEIAKTIIEGITCGIACGALSYTIREYRRAKERNKANALAKFNERYTTEPSIRAVIQWLTLNEFSPAYRLLNLSRQKTNHTSESEKSNGKQLEKYTGSELVIRNNAAPTLYDFEVTARFFEEIEYAITQGYLDSETACEFFGYYAPQVSLYLSDYNTGNNPWRLYRKFVRRCIKS